MGFAMGSSNDLLRVVRMEQMHGSAYSTGRKKPTRCCLGCARRADLHRGANQAIRRRDPREPDEGGSAGPESLGVPLRHAGSLRTSCIATARVNERIKTEANRSGSIELPAISSLEVVRLLSIEMSSGWPITSHSSDQSAQPISVPATSNTPDVRLCWARPTSLRPPVSTISQADKLPKHAQFTTLVALTSLACGTSHGGNARAETPILLNALTWSCPRRR